MIAFEVRHGGSGRGWYVVRVAANGARTTASGPWTSRAQAEADAEFRRQEYRFLLRQGHSVKAPTEGEEP